MHLASRRAPLALLPELSCEPDSDRSGADYEHVVVGLDALGDVCEEPRQMLEAVRFARGLRGPAAAVPDARIVPDVAGRAVVRGNIGRHRYDVGLTIARADQERVPRVDPDERQVPLGRRRQER